MLVVSAQTVEHCVVDCTSIQQQSCHISLCSCWVSMPPTILFFIMYFGLQDTKPPPCPLHLTKRGGSIHCSKLYFYALYKLVLYILSTITIYCIIARREQITNKFTEIIQAFFILRGILQREMCRDSFMPVLRSFVQRY